VSDHEDDEDDAKAHEARDWELIEGHDLEKRAEGLLCIARRRGDDNNTQDESLTFAEAAEQIYRELGDTKQLLAALWAKADALFYFKRFDEAKDASIEAGEIAASQFMDAQAGAMFFNAGGCAHNLGEPEEAISHYYSGARFHEAADNPIESGKCLAWAGRNQLKLGNFDDAIADYSRAIAFFEEHGAMMKLADCSRLLAKVYIAKGDVQLAGEALDRSESCLELVTNEEITQKNRFARALLMAAAGNHPEAIKAFDVLYIEARAASHPEYSAHALFQRAKSQLAAGVFDEAAKAFRNIALAVKGTKSDITTLDALLQLVKVYELSGNDRDHELTLRELLALPGIEERPLVMNLMTLQLGLLLSKLPGDPRGLKVLEGLPRDTFAVGTDEWMEHSMGLLQNYSEFGRTSECLFLANELLAQADHGYFEALIAEIHAIKTEVLAKMGDEPRAKAEAKLAYEQLTNINELERAQRIKARFLTDRANKPEANYLLSTHASAEF
jgi:tetratricopeptide (TPR) repeat protein